MKLGANAMIGDRKGVRQTEATTKPACVEIIERFYPKNQTDPGFDDLFLDDNGNSISHVD